MDNETRKALKELDTAWCAFNIATKNLCFATPGTADFRKKEITYARCDDALNEVRRKYGWAA